MPRECPSCHARARRGSTYCPYCGGVMDDGINLRGHWMVVGIAIFVGIATIVIFFGMVFSQMKR